MPMLESQRIRLRILADRNLKDFVLFLNSAVIHSQTDMLNSAAGNR